MQLSFAASNKPMPLRRAFLVQALLAVSVTVVLGQGRSNQTSRDADIDALVEKSDPAADDWTTEVQHTHAKHQLKRLGQKLVDMVGAKAEKPAFDDVFGAGAKMPLVDLGSVDLIRRGAMQVRRIRGADESSGSAVDPSRALSALVASFSGESLRVKFKIIGVTAGEAGKFSTLTLFQSSGQATKSDASVQHNGRWEIAWEPGPDEDHPLIRSVNILTCEEITSPRTTFVDAARSVITDHRAWDEQLRFGGDYWYGKTDAVGEINYFGHEGIAIGDVNGDGLDDLYVGMGTGIPNKLYVQNADGTCRDTAAEAGVAWLDSTKGVLLVDLDNDGDQDLLMTTGPTIVYCQNDGSGKFVPVRRMRAGTDAAFYSLAAADYDLDGDLDIYATRYVKQRYGLSVPVPFHDANNGPPNHLMRNDGEKGFTDVTRDVGLSENNGRFSLSASWADYDDDGDPDLYVANDFGRNNLYRNDKGKFVDVAASAGAEDQAAGMGVTWSDFDLDGDLDLYVSNMFSSAGRRIAYQPRFKKGDEDTRRQIQHHSLGNALMVNQGDGTFRDASDSAGVRMGRWAWGAVFADFNNDGYDDIIVPNGFLTNEGKDDL
jgi:FG-GAP-like repeat